MFMSSLRDEFTFSPQNSVTDVSVSQLGSGRHVGAHPDGHQYGVSIQSSIDLGRSFLRIPRQGSYSFKPFKFHDFLDFFHDLSKFYVTFGLAVTFKAFQTFSRFGVFLTFNSSKDTNSGVHKNACRSHCFITPLYLTLHLLLSPEVSREVANLPHKALTFHDFQGPTIKFDDPPSLENEILKFHDFPGFP